MKFGSDGLTEMQRGGRYDDIARKNGLDPEQDVIQIDVDQDCACSKNEDGKTTGKTADGVEKCE